MNIEDFIKIQAAFPTELSDSDKYILEGLGSFHDVESIFYSEELVITTAFRRFIQKSSNYYLQNFKKYDIIISKEGEEA